MLQTRPPPPSWKPRFATAAIVLGLGAYFTITAVTMGADGYDEATAQHRIDALHGILTSVDIPAGTYDLSWVTIYNGEPVTTGWNIDVRIVDHSGTEVLNKTYGWSETTSCISCSSTSVSTRMGLERVTLSGGNYSVTVRINFATTTGVASPTRAVLSFLDPQKELFFGSYIWIGLGFFLVMLGVWGLWRRHDRKAFGKWLNWKRAAEGEEVAETKKERRKRLKGK